MVDRLVLVNGLPGSGKTSLAVPLARALSATLVSKDAIKEAVADVVTTAPSSLLGAAAIDMAWNLAAGTTGTVVLESWWFRPRDLTFATAGLDRCGAPAVVEVWCDVPADVARARYENRRRHRVHDDERPMDESWRQWAVAAEPLGVGPTVRVRTDRPVDIALLASEVTAAFQAPVDQPSR